MGRSTSTSRPSSSRNDSDAEIVSTPTSCALRRGLSDPARLASLSLHHVVAEIEETHLNDVDETPKVSNLRRGISAPGSLAKMEKIYRLGESLQRSERTSRKPSRSSSKEGPRRRSKDRSRRRQRSKEPELDADDDQKLRRRTNSANGIKAPDDLGDIEQRETEEAQKPRNRSKQSTQHDEVDTKVPKTTHKSSSTKKTRSKSLDCETLDDDGTTEKGPQQRPSILRAKSLDVDTELNQCMTRLRTKSVGFELDDSIDNTDKANEPPPPPPLAKPSVDPAFDPAFFKPAEKRNKSVELYDQFLGEMRVAGPYDVNHQGSDHSRDAGDSIVSLDTSNSRRAKMEIYMAARKMSRSISPWRETSTSTSSSVLKSTMLESVQSTANGGDWSHDPVEAFKTSQSRLNNDPVESFNASRSRSADGLSNSASSRTTLRRSKTSAEMDKPKRRSKSTEDPFDQRVTDALERKREKRKSGSSKSKKHFDEDGDEVEIMDVNLSDLLAAAMSEIDAPVVRQPQRAHSMHRREIRPLTKIGPKHSSLHERSQRNSNGILPGNELMARSDNSKSRSRETSSFFNSFTTDGEESESDELSPQGISFDFERYFGDGCITDRNHKSRVRARSNDSSL